MDGAEKQYTKEDRQINDWSYDGISVVESLPVWALAFGCTACTLHKYRFCNMSNVYDVFRSAMVACCSKKLLSLEHGDICVSFLTVVVFVSSVDYICNNGKYIQGVPGRMCQTSGECSLH